MASLELPPASSGSKRRLLLRYWLGKSGSLRRWILGSVVWLALCFWIFTLTGDLAVLLFAVLADITAFVARTLLVGDEDELNAALSESLFRAMREGVPPADHEELDPEQWFVRGSRRFEGVPLPPVAEEAADGELPDDGTA